MKGAGDCGLSVIHCGKDRNQEHCDALGWVGLFQLHTILEEVGLADRLKQIGSSHCGPHPDYAVQSVSVSTIVGILRHDYLVCGPTGRDGGRVIVVASSWPVLCLHPSPHAHAHAHAHAIVLPAHQEHCL